MIHKFNDFIKESTDQTTDQSINHIAQLCERYKIRDYDIRPNGIVDVNGDVNLTSNGLEKLPLKFGRVSGSFWAASNELKTLEGSPEYVGKTFMVDSNNLTSLKHSPKEVSVFSASDNSIDSLIGMPEKVGGSLLMAFNEIRTLKGYTYQREHSIINFKQNPIDEITSIFYGKRDTYEGVYYIKEYGAITDDGKGVYYDIILEVLEKLNDHWEYEPGELQKRFKSYNLIF